jgi:DNA-binding transcriptional LysR family regulator
VVFRPLRDATPTPALCMAWRADNDSPVLAAFLDAARSAVQAG